MTDLEHCVILGSESIDANSLNRCVYNLYNKMGEFNAQFLNSTSENLPATPFASGGYDNVLDLDYVSNLGTLATTATTENCGLVKRLYKGDVNIIGSIDNDSYKTESVTGVYTYNAEELSGHAPTVDTLYRDENPLILKSILENESMLTTATSAFGSIYSPTIKYTSFLTTERNGVSFGTVTFKRVNGDVQDNILYLDIQQDLIGMDGVEKINFFTIGNGVASGVKVVSENLDMITDINPCNITYTSDTSVIVSNITKNDNSEAIRIENKTGRILGDDEVLPYNEYTEIKNDEVVLNFYIMFKLKDEVIKYSDSLWCFYLTPDIEYGRKYLANAKNYARNYFKYSFDNFEAADNGKVLDDGTHFVWGEGDVENDPDDIGGCTTIASDAFNGCYNATFKSLYWLSPRLRYTDRMFKNCSKATFDKLPSNLVSEAIRDSSSMFENCKSASFSNIESINYLNSTKVSYMFSGCLNATFDSLTSVTFGGNGEGMFKKNPKAFFDVLEKIDGSGTRFTSMFEECDNASFEKLTSIESNSDRNINSSRMFYYLKRPEFNGLSEIGFTTDNAKYNGTSMFEGCINAQFKNLTSLGNVYDGTRMFMGLDEIGESEIYNFATFENLHSFGEYLKIGRKMFQDCSHATFTITSEDTPVVYGSNMFNNTSSVVFEHNLNDLIDAEYMFSNTLTSVVKGDMNSLVDGSGMFSYCVSADTSGTMDKLSNMYNMFYNSDYVHVKEIPTTAKNMQSAFSMITGECLIEDWKKAKVDRICYQTFENSKNVTVKGNILDGDIVDTSYMFKNVSGDLVLVNKDMEHDSDTQHRYFRSRLVGDYAILNNFDNDNEDVVNLTFIGTCTYDNIGTNGTYDGLATSGDVVNSLLCFEHTQEVGVAYSLYTTASGYTENSDGTITVATSSLGGLSADEIKSVCRYNDGEREYGTLYTDRDNKKITIYFKKSSNNQLRYSSDFIYGSYSSDEEPVIQTFIGGEDNYPPKWKYASHMFENVVQSDLLSGYDLIVSPSLTETDYMFALDNRVEGDGTFNNAGYLFREMSNSKIVSMRGMFKNRNISNSSVFTDIHTMEVGALSFSIPYNVVDAASAFQNCTISTPEGRYIYLDIPNTLVNANHMFDGFNGTLIRLDDRENGEIYITDTIECENMFNGCKFKNYNDDSKFKMSIPSIYLEMFKGSDFRMDDISNITIRDNKTFAYPYSNTRYFNNEVKLLGCSSQSYSKLEDDISAWFRSNFDDTDYNVFNIEGVYLATVVAPANYGNHNFELLEATKNENGVWDVQLAPVSRTQTEQWKELLRCGIDGYGGTNGLLMDNIKELNDSNGRFTAMFAPDVLFNGTYWDEQNNIKTVSETRLGDKLLYAMTHFPVIIGRLIQLNKYDYYTNLTFNSLERINGLEMAFMFANKKNAVFNNLKTIGSDCINAYAMFAGCKNAIFDKLEDITFFNTKNVNREESRYNDKTLSDDDYDILWKYNYAYMFFNCEKATFSSLKHIGFNYKTTNDKNGKNVSIWYNNQGEANVLFYNKIGKLYKSYRYRIKTIAEQNKNVKFDVYNEDNTLYTSITTDVQRVNAYNIVYEVCEVDGEKTVIITFEDGTGKYYYSFNPNNQLTKLVEHPKEAYVADTANFAIHAFSENGAFISGDRFTDLNDNYYTIKTCHDETSECYSLQIHNYNGTKVLNLGTPFTNEDDIRNVYYTRLVYNQDGNNYVAISIFKTDTPPNPTQVKYPSNTITYRLYNNNDNINIEQLHEVPGTIKYEPYVSIVHSDSSVYRQLIRVDGMFWGCRNATFENLEAVVFDCPSKPYPYKDNNDYYGCTGMFKDCENIKLDTTHMSIFMLPESISIGSFGSCNLFQNTPTSGVNLFGLTLSNSNLHLIRHDRNGQELFGYMKHMNGTNGYPTYQSAVFEMNLDSSIAKLIFKRDNSNIKNVKYYVDGELYRTVEVESGNPVRLFNLNTIMESRRFLGWAIYDHATNEFIGAYDYNESKFDNVTKDLDVYAQFNDDENLYLTADDGNGVERFITTKYDENTDEESVIAT